MYGSCTEIAVLLRMFYDLFETYETFLRCIFVQQERKCNL